MAKHNTKGDLWIVLYGRKTRQTGGTDRHTTQTGMHAGRQAGRQTDRQTHTHTEGSVDKGLEEHEYEELEPCGQAQYWVRSCAL